MDYKKLLILVEKAPIDYGYYALVYPVYDEETEGTSYEVMEISVYAIAKFADGNWWKWGICEFDECGGWSKQYGKE